MFVTQMVDVYFKKVFHVSYACLMQAMKLKIKLTNYATKLRSKNMLIYFHIFTLHTYMHRFVHCVTIGGIQISVS